MCEVEKKSRSFKMLNVLLETHKSCLSCHCTMKKQVGLYSLLSVGIFTNLVIMS